MSKKQKVKLKLFKVFYFPKPDDYYFSKVEMIMAKNEAEAEAIFRLWYRDRLKDDPTFFGWIEEVNTRRKQLL